MENGHYIVKNAGYNYNIEARTSVSFGFVLNGTADEMIMKNFILKTSAGGANNMESDNANAPAVEDLGEIYCKELESGDVLFDEESGIRYVRNQVLISAYSGMDKGVIEMIAGEVEAKIVGYIELTNDYQLEFMSDKSFEELGVIIDFLNSFSFISFCSLNYYSESVTDGEVPWNDALYIDGLMAWNKGGKGYTYYAGKPVADEAELYCKTGDNWGLKALNIPSAWSMVDSNRTVKVGIYDHGFAQTHEDLSFAKQYNSGLGDDGEHGTHIAGIIGAKHNNIGIAGVAPNTQLFTYAYAGGGYGAMREKVAFSSLIGNHVKVINFSQAWDRELAYAATISDSLRNEEVLRGIMFRARAIEEFLLKTCQMGYDFVIVTSAGNANDYKYIEDVNTESGYRVVERDVYEGKREKPVLAIYNSALNAISNPVIKEKIIVVGAIQYDGKADSDYSIGAGTSVGERLDVLAPGINVLSTVPMTYAETDIKGYALMSGTSMAAPYIAGLVALMYQANPSIRASEVKSIICNTDHQVAAFTDAVGITHPMPDAAACVKAAINAEDGKYFDNTYGQGILIGKIVGADEEGISDVSIAVTRQDAELNASYRGGVYYFQTTSDGIYTCSVPRGRYDLLISKAGCFPVKLNGIDIREDETFYLETIRLTELGTETFGINTMKGSVMDAVSGHSLAGAQIRLRPGFNNRAGAYVMDKGGYCFQTFTDAGGYFSLSVYVGSYTAEVVKEGYVTGYFNISVIKGFDNQNKLVLTPILDEDEYRIILSWGSSPRDLDSHLSYLLDEKRIFHVAYYSKTASYEGKKIAMLDLDDIDGYGPETVTITVNADLVEEGRFSYAVHDYSNRSDYSDTRLSASGAKVLVYKGSDLKGTYNVPLNKTGTVWHVFDLDKSGIKTINAFGNDIP